MSAEGGFGKMLDRYANSGAARFHMPGHKGVGVGFFADIFKSDITELSFSDNLASPEDTVADIQRRWAETLDAENTLLLVNGSTTGILAMILALGTNKRVLLGRDCHMSAINALALAHDTAVPVFPDANGVLSAEKIDRALTAEPCDAVFITYPNYYGVCLDIEEVSETARKHGALLLVDNAHGAHFAFSPRFPKTPSRYADAWVTSVHKTLPSLTQTAVLCRGFGSRIDDGALKRCVNMVQSSSPSYILMRSLEYALECAKGLDFEAHIERVERVRERISALHGYSIGERSEVKDASRLTIDTRGRGICGFDVARFLESKNVYVEMADRDKIVCITSPLDKDEWYDRLINALDDAPQREPMPQIVYEPFGERTTPLDIGEAMFAESEDVCVESAVGRRVSRAFGIYPPGVALLMPSETVRETDVREVQRQMRLGAKFFGMSSNMLSCIKE